MRSKKDKVLEQRALIDKRLLSYRKLRSEPVSRSGWLKAIRGSLGISTSQLARIMGINQSGVTRLEEIVIKALNLLLQKGPIS